MKKNFRRELFALAALAAIVALAFVAAHFRRGGGSTSREIAVNSTTSIESNLDVGYRRGPESFLCVHVGEEYALIGLTAEGSVVIRREDGRVNTVSTGVNSFFMGSASCANQDCVHQGTVTLENRDRRVLTNYVICLPNEVILEMMDADEAAAFVAASGGGMGS